jgi:hypothetical protein
MTQPFSSWRMDHVQYPRFFKAGCYICEDIEFALMGLPLCYPCKYCQGHVAADDTICDECGKDQHDDTES